MGLQRFSFSAAAEVSVWQHKDDTSIYVDCLEQTIREERAGLGGGFFGALGPVFALRPFAGPRSSRPLPTLQILWRPSA